MMSLDEIRVRDLETVRIGMLQVVAARLCDIREVKDAILSMPAHAERLQAVADQLLRISDMTRELEAELGRILDEHRAGGERVRSEWSEILPQ